MPSESAEKKLCEALAAEKSTAVQSRFEPESSVRAALAELPSARAWVQGQLNSFVEQRDVNQVAKLLDLVLSNNELDALYFAALESALAMLPLDLCRDLWPYLEARQAVISDKAQGPNSIVLLRTCRSMLTRLHPELQSLEAGRVLVFLAAVKGFAHPSRLNKRGKVSRRGYFDADAPNEQAVDWRASPYATSIQLRDLGSLDAAELRDFLRFLRERFAGKRLNGRNYGDGPIDLYGAEWRNRPPQSELQLLSDETLIALARLETESAAQDADTQKLIQAVRAEIERMKHGAMSRYTHLFQSEREWRQWKLAMCPYIDISEAALPARAENGGEPFAQDTDLPELGANVGNERLTQLLKASADAANFDSPLDWTAAAQKYSGLAASAETKDNKEAFGFKARRCQPWSALLEQQAATTPNTHAELKAEEEKMNTSLKRPAAAAESAPKRARLSYEEDSRYQDRQRGMQSTARPLPY